jgi:hypothetical protein
MLKKFLSVEELHTTAEYLRLPTKQRAFVDKFIECEHDKRVAYQALHPATKKTSVEAAANKLFSLPAVRAALDVYFVVDPLDAVKAEIRKAMQDKKITPARVQALKLFAASYGISIGGAAGEVSESPEPPKPEGTLVSDRIVERDGRRLRQVVTDLGPAEEKS